MFNRYYQDELAKLRNLALEFSRHNPALAPMLSASSSDPDVERLLEGVAFLTGLIRQKLDAEFPEFIQEVANLLFPHYLRPVPGCTLIRFTPKSSVNEVVKIPAGTELASVPVDGTVCRFRTVSLLTMQPLNLTGAVLQPDETGVSMLRLQFELTGITLTQWQGDSLRLFLADAYADAAKLALLLLTRVRRVTVVPAQGCSRVLSPDSIRLAGFDQPLLPYPGNAFSSFRQIQEFFVIPEKFLFIEFSGLAGLASGKGSSFVLDIAFDSWPEWAPDISKDSLQLNVVPAINLFAHATQPIAHEHRLAEYRLAPEGLNQQHYQIHSIDKVTGYRQGEAKEHRYLPFGLVGDGKSRNYRSVRRPATVGRGSDLYLSIHYDSEQTLQPETLSIEVSCSNRYLPESLKLGDISQPTASSPDRMHFANIRGVTATQEPPAGENLLWRMISHMSMNFLSLADAENLRKLLRLYLFGEDAENEGANGRRINGIVEVRSQRETRLMGKSGLMRGQGIRICCQGDHFAGPGDLYLFGCVLERLINDYTGINAYSRVELEDIQSGVLYKWPGRLGQQCLL